MMGARMRPPTDKEEIAAQTIKKRGLPERKAQGRDSGLGNCGKKAYKGAKRLFQPLGGGSNGLQHMGGERESRLPQRYSAYEDFPEQQKFVLR